MGSGARTGELTAAAFTQYLRGRGVAGGVADLRKIGGGASRETWLVTVEGSDQLPNQVLIRKDTPYGATIPTSLQREYAVLSHLHRHGVRVPDPLWFEEDTAWFGAPFYLRRGYSGTSDQRRFTGDAAKRLSVELARALADFHRAPIEGFLLDGEASPSTIDQAVSSEVEHWFRVWTEKAPEPVPFLHELTRWLRNNRPAVAEPPVLVWGDVGVANTVCAPEGRVLALSDFELVTFGDPMRDVASALWRGVDRLAGRDVFLDAYTRFSGRAVDPDRIRYYMVFANWQISMFSHTAAAEVGAEADRSLHPALLRIWIHHINLHKAGRLIGV